MESKVFRSYALRLPGLPALVQSHTIVIFFAKLEHFTTIRYCLLNWNVSMNSICDLMQFKITFLPRLHFLFLCVFRLQKQPFHFRLYCFF